MRLAGRVFKSDSYWAIEVPMLGVVTQGRSKKDAFLMIADAVESLVNRADFRLDVFPGEGDYFEIGANDEPVLMAFLLRRERARSGLSLAEVAKRLGAQSANAYARYEQGRSVPTVPKLTALLAAVAPEKHFVLAESRASVAIETCLPGNADLPIGRSGQTNGRDGRQPRRSGDRRSQNGRTHGGIPLIARARTGRFALSVRGGIRSCASAKREGSNARRSGRLRAR